MDPFTNLLTSSTAVLKDTSAEWKVRVAALKKIRDALQDTRFDKRVGALRPIVPCLCRQVTDGRSAVTVEACQTIGAICETLGDEAGFDPWADAFVKALLPLVVSSAGVVAEAAQSALAALVKGTTRGYQAVFDRLLQGSANGRAAQTRRACMQLAQRALECWDREWLCRGGGNAASVEVALRKAIRDADADARAAGRLAYWAFASVFPEEARRLLRDLEGAERLLIEQARREPAVEPLVPVLKRASSVKSTASLAAAARPSESLRFELPPSTRIAPAVARTPAAPTEARLQAPATASKPPLLSARPVLLDNAPPRSALKLSLRASVNEQTPSLARKTPSKTTTPHHDRVAWALLGAGDPEASRRVTAMQDLASYVVSSPSSPPEQLGDIVDAVAACAEDESPAVVAAAMDAFGALVWAHGDYALASLDRLLPLALKHANAAERKAKVAADRAVQACVGSFAPDVVIDRVIAAARSALYASDRTYACEVLAQLAADASEAEFERVARAALEWKDSSLSDALYEARPDAVARLVDGLVASDDNVAIAAEPVAAGPGAAAAWVKLLNDGDADNRKRAVDALVRLRAAGDATLAAQLNPAQLRLIDIFERKTRPTCAV